MKLENDSRKMGHVPENVVRDSSLSLRAKGLYALISSYGEAGIDLSEIVQACNEPEGDVFAAFLELEKAGHI